MLLADFAFAATDWSTLEPTEHKGETGVAYWRTLNFGDVRVRMITYSAGYLADHWCVKGHVLLCTEGELHTDSLEIECWKHGSCFSLVDGTPNTLPATQPVPVYEVRIDGNDVLVVIA